MFDEPLSSPGSSFVKQNTAMSFPFQRRITRGVLPRMNKFFSTQRNISATTRKVEKMPSSLNASPRTSALRNKFQSKLYPINMRVDPSLTIYDFQGRNHPLHEGFRSYIANSFSQVSRPPRSLLV